MKSTIKLILSMYLFVVLIMLPIVGHSSVAIDGYKLSNLTVKGSINGQEFVMPVKLFVSSVKDGRLTISSDLDVFYVLYLDGEINKKTADDFILISKLLTSNAKFKRPALFDLNSKGGSVYAAIKIAEEIRKIKNKPFTWSAIFATGECSSACVFILAAGWDRRVLSGVKIGIHRPFFSADDNAPKDYKELTNAYEKLRKRLTRLFQDMNIHPSFINDMWSIPSSDIKYLSESRLSYYGLNQEDMIINEQNAIRLREECGPNGPSMKHDYDVKLRQCHVNVPDFNNGDPCIKTVTCKHPITKCDKNMIRQYSNYCGHKH